MVLPGSLKVLLCSAAFVQKVYPVLLVDNLVRFRFTIFENKLALQVLHTPLFH